MLHFICYVSFASICSYAKHCTPNVIFICVELLKKSKRICFNTCDASFL